MTFPPKRVSSKLQALLPDSFVIGEGRITKAQLPEKITDSTGTVYQRPDGWKKPAIPAQPAGPTTPGLHC